MPTQILATAGTAADSADVVVTADGLTVSLKGAAGVVPRGAVVYIKLKDDAGAYVQIDELTSSKKAQFIAGAGTYRFSRPAGPSVGVFSG